MCSWIFSHMLWTKSIPYIVPTSQSSTILGNLFANLMRTHWELDGNTLGTLGTTIPLVDDCQHGNITTLLNKKTLLTTSWPFVCFSIFIFQWQYSWELHFNMCKKTGSSCVMVVVIPFKDLRKFWLLESQKKNPLFFFFFFMGWWFPGRGHISFHGSAADCMTSKSLFL